MNSHFNILASGMPLAPLAFDCLCMAMGKGVAIFNLLYIV
jgi:hypothetical protein